MPKRIFLICCIVFLMTFAFVLQPPIASATNLSESTHTLRLSPKHGGYDLCPSSSNQDDSQSAQREINETLPTLEEFTAFVVNADPTTIVGVYVCHVLALRVTQQPMDNPVYVSEDLGTATQFRLASAYGTIGLLAHNDRAGARFLNLMLGHEVDVVYGDGSIRRYLVSGIRHFQPLRPDDPYSDFNDLDNGGDPVSSTQVFQQFFTGGDQVVFQTCISANGNYTWGRLFVIATPLLTN